MRSFYIVPLSRDASVHLTIAVCTSQPDARTEHCKQPSSTPAPSWRGRSAQTQTQKRGRSDQHRRYAESGTCTSHAACTERNQIQGKMERRKIKLPLRRAKPSFAYDGHPMALDWARIDIPLALRSNLIPTECSLHTRPTAGREGGVVGVRTH